MPRWPLLLLLPAVSTSTSLTRFLIVHRRRVTIAPSLAVKLPLSLPSRCTLHHPQFVIVPSPPIAVVLSVHHRRARAVPRANEEPSRRPLPSRSRRAVHCCRHQGAIAPSLAVKEPSRRPSPSRSHRAVPRRQGSVAPSIAVAVEEPSRAVPHRRGAVAPSIAVAIEEPSRRTSPSRSHRPCLLTTPATCHAPPRPLVRMVVALPLLMPPPSIFRRLSLRHHLSFEVIFRVVVSFGFFHVS